MIFTKFMKYIKRQYLSVLYVLLVILFAFTYFIIYRTDSRVAWYEEMQVQTENLIKYFREVVHINK